jgi:esterase
MTEAASRFTGFAPKLHFLEWNSDAPRAILLLHGNSANAWWWQPTTDAMRTGARWRLVALDLRGHGDSEWVRPPAYAPLDYARDLARFIGEYSLSQPIVVGHSMGGIAAITFAAEYPGVAGAIVAIDVALTSSQRRNHYLRRLKALPIVNYPDLGTARERFRLMPNEGKIAPETLAMVATKSLGQTADGRWTMKFDRESFLGSDGTDVLGSIARVRDPILLIRAEHSRIMTVEAARKALASNTVVRMTTMPGAYHHVILEKPQAIALTIEEFAASL